MQGQRSDIGSLTDSINFVYGSSISHVSVNQQVCWNNLQNPAESRLYDYRIPGGSSSETFMGGVKQGKNLSRWSVGESSSSNPQNLVSYDDRMTQSGWPYSMNSSVGAGWRLEEQLYEPTNFDSHTRVNLNISSSTVVAGPSFVRSSDTDSASQNHDLNDVNIHRVGDDMDCPNSSSQSTVFENEFLPSASSSSDPFASSSESGDFLLEEDECRPGCSLVGRRPCKRKTFEGNAGQSSSSRTCYFRVAEDQMWHVSPPCYDTNDSVNVFISSESSGIVQTKQVNPRFGLDMGGAVPANSLRPLSVSGGPDTSQRNNHLRVHPSMQQDSVPNNPLSPAPGGGARRPDFLTDDQPLRHVPMSPLDLMSQIPSNSPVPSSQPVILRLPALRRNVQAHRWNRAPNLRPGSSSSSVFSAGETDAASPEYLNSRNVSRNVAEHPMFIPLVEARNPAQTSAHCSARSSNVGGPRNIPSSSCTLSASASHSAPGPSWASHRCPSQYSRRLPEYVQRSFFSTISPESATQRSNRQVHAGPTSSQEGIPLSNGNQGHNQSYSRSALWIDREGDGAVGIPYSLRALAASGEGRRLVSELRNVLDNMHRGEGLCFEDFTILDQSMLFGREDILDQHRDMRLDVDNMSYEELLALEERIGNVCTGLSEDIILNRMRQHKYIHTMSDEQIETEPCCICQEEYSDGEGLGTLDCGHNFHSECIKQWLAHKNLCPICKTTGLAT